MDKLAILFVVEPGLLEKQAILLINSINTFLKPHCDCDVFTFSPRKNRKPSDESMAFLKANVTQHFNLDLNLDYDNFPLINGHIAATFFEKKFPEYTNILLTDTDTVFLNKFPESIMGISKPYIQIKPVDNKGVGTDGRLDGNLSFWKNLYSHLKISLPTETLTTSVRQDKIWPYYNAGFVMVNKLDGFFTQWLDDFCSIYNSDIRASYQGKGKSNTIYLEQVALALVSQRNKEHIKNLSIKINYPIPFHPIIKDRPNHPKFNELVHVHYHKWFQHPGFLDHVTDDDEKKSEQYLWLKEHLPLLPEIGGDFKC